MRLTDRALLHRRFSWALTSLDAHLTIERIPLRLYEGARTPWRQAELYARGRTVPGAKIVTRAKAWQSFHQYGLAADFVFHVNGKWTWTEPRNGQWKRFQELARVVGLETLSFEMPHVQMPARLADLKRGVYPEGGGDEWEAWLGDQIERWGSVLERDVSGVFHPPASPPFDVDERPAMEVT